MFNEYEIITMFKTCEVKAKNLGFDLTISTYFKLNNITFYSVYGLYSYLCGFEEGRCK